MDRETIKALLGDRAAQEPLTMEQLRQMDGKPAYWPEDESWGIIAVDSVGKWAGIPFFRGRWQGVNFEYDIEARGMEVYAYPPAQIDLEAWTPCEYCKDRHLEKVHVKTCGNGDMGISAEVGRVNREEKTGIVILQGFAAAGYVEFDFCPFCGRPQTSEAKAMLEKQLRGCVE